MSDPKKNPRDAAPADDTKADTSSPSPGAAHRPRGKMYWKFAAIEGWRAGDEQSPKRKSPEEK